MPSNLLPTATNVGSLVSIPNNGLLNTLPTAPNNVGNLLSAATADVSNIASRFLPIIITGGATAVPTIANGVGNVGNVGNVPSQVLATVNGQATALPVVTTILNGVPTAVPVISQIIGGVASLVPVVAGGLNQVIGGTSNGGVPGGTGSGLTGGLNQVIGGTSSGGIASGTTNNGLTGAIGQVIGGTPYGGVAGGINGGLVNTLGDVSQVIGGTSNGGVTSGTTNTGLTGGIGQVIGGTSNGGLTGMGNGLFGGVKRRRASQRGKGEVIEAGREK